MVGNYNSDKANLLSILHDIVQENIDCEDFDVETFAAKAGMSRSELYRKIKKHSGKSVTQFIRDIRLNEGMKLIEETDLTIAEISYRVGFNSPTYFNKCFKEKFGITPGEADAGKTPFSESIYNDSLKDNPQLAGSIWRSRNLWIIFSLVFLSALGYWYYLSSQTSSTQINDPEPNAKATEPIIKRKHSIAVLPLQNWTGTSDYDYICYGISDAIITKLLEMEVVDRITPLSPIMKVRDSIPDARVLAKKFGVENILDGNVQKAGNQLKFSLQFYNIDSSNVYWSKQFIINWDPEQAFDMQKNISEEIAATLNIESRDPTSPAIPTTSVTAYNNYLKGIYESSKATFKSWQISLDFFEKAIEEDPQFLNAYIASANSWLYNGLIWAYCSQEEGKSNALKYLNMAIERGLANEEVLRVVREIQFYYDLNVSGKNDSIPEIEDFDLASYSQDFAKKIGDYEKNIKLIKGVLKNDPLNGLYISLLAQSYFLKGEESNARKLLEDSYDTHKGKLDYLREVCKTYYFMGDFEKLESTLTDYTTQFEERPPIIIWFQTIVADKNNNITLRDSYLQRLQTDFNNRAPGSPGWFIALYHAYREDYDACISWLEKSYKAGEVEMTWLAQEPDLAPLGGNPRYQALLDSMNFPADSRRHVRFLN